jgi:hypothetical protein
MTRWHGCGLDGWGKETPMFIAFALILLFAWLLGFSVFHIASVAIHILLVAALISVLLHFLFGMRRMT